MNGEAQHQNFDTEELYTAFFTPVFRFVFFRTQDYELSSDIAQQSFLKFMESARHLPTQEDARRFLFAIARNLLIDHWRSTAAHGMVAVSDLDRASSLQPSIESTLIAKEDIAFLQSLVRELSGIEADVFTLRISDDLPYATIAVLLEISIVNARQIYVRALRKLKKLSETSPGDYDYGTAG